MNKLIEILKDLFGAPVALAAVALLFIVTPPAQAQSFDEFNAVQTILVTPAVVKAGSTVWSNNPIDLRSAIGVSKIDIAVFTNGVAGATTINIYTSPDLTNWTTLANCCVATNSTSIISTNNYYGTGTPLATNAVMLAGVITTPTASTAGWATPYILAQPFTNTGVILCAAGGHFTVGFNTQDAGRYLSVAYTGQSTSTNFYHAVFTGSRSR